MIIKGSKIELAKPMGVFANVGEVCEVTDVVEGGIISFRFGGCHLGCMSYDEYQKYFVDYVEPVKIKREWTKWNETETDHYTLEGEYRCLTILYRSNDKKVEVKLSGSELKASSCCNKVDEFDLDKGIDLAIARLKVKMLNEEAKNMASKM